MPRAHKRKLGSRTYRNYTEETLQQAVDLVRNKKLTLREASDRFNIHRNTLWLKLHGKHEKSVGKPPVFKSEEEKQLVGHIIAMSSYGFPVTTFDLRCVVSAFLERSGRKVKCFSNNFPGVDWAEAFLKRHKEVLSQRTAKNISHARAATDETIITQFFTSLEAEQEGVPATNVWNYDETNLVDDPGSVKIITRRGAKYPERIRNATKACTSMMLCGNAAGELAPIYVNYKAEKLWSTWTEGGPDNARYNRTKSGWFDYQVFEDWFQSLLLPILKKQEGTKIIIGDNLSSHINVEVVRLCQENNIKFIALPPNATHLLQPLDVAFFRPMKSAWRKALNNWKETAMGSRCPSIPKDVFPSLLKELMDTLKPNIANNLIAGFKKTGIFPIDKEIVLDRLPRRIVGADKHTDLLSNSFIEHLEKKRDETTQGRVRQRRKRLNVPPGKSFALSDFEEMNTINSCDEGEPQPSNSRMAMQSKRRKRAVSESSCDQSDIEIPDSESSLEDNDVSDIEKEKPTSKPNSAEIEIGDYVIVKYEEKFYPGLVVSMLSLGKITVNAMERTGCHWKWPDRKDEVEYELEEIHMKIARPKQISRREIFEVPELRQFDDFL